MEVILMDDVAGLGTQGQVVNVKAGHARNLLFPRKLAAEVTVATKRRLEKKAQLRMAQEAAEIAAVTETKTLIEALSCTIAAKVGEEGKMFGSVNVNDIMVVLQRHGVKIDKSLIQLEAPLKELGVFEVPVRLHAKVVATLKVWVVQE